MHHFGSDTNKMFELAVRRPVEGRTLMFKSDRMSTIIIGWIILTPFVMATEFNLQVMERVNERLNDFMTIPVDIATRAYNFRALGGFRSNLDASDRVDFTRFLFLEKPRLLYFGLEDGTFSVYTIGFETISYREPGESGYDAIDIPPDKKKYFKSCVNSTNGAPIECLLAGDQPYISCVNDCELVPCQDEETQAICNSTSSTADECKTNLSVKLCKNYNIKTAGGNDTLGFIPRTKSCINIFGRPEQAPGLVLINATTSTLGNCSFEDGITLVNRTLSGPYADCQLPSDQRDNQNLITCNNTFVGGYESSNYDPRFRPWFIQAKLMQSPLWTDPYPFFDNGMGITYCQPIYSLMQPGQQIFAGVIAVDYYLVEFADFLTNEYYGTDMIVFVVESKSPNYIMASSTGSSSTKYVLTSNTSLPCPYEDYYINPRCEVTRVPISEFIGDPMDFIIQRTFTAHQAVNFPTNELVYVTENDKVGSKAFITQGSPYKQLTAKNLEWHVFVIMPMTQSTTDAALRGDTIFVVVCLIATLGLMGCLCLFVLFFRQRRERAVMHADWRFTCAFILGCALLNLSTFTLLGPNTRATCMLRMWSFNALFVAALTPLFVKVWRMYKLVSASSGFQRVAMTNARAFLYTLPLFVTEIVLLTIFSIVDPPLPVESFDSGGGDPLQSVTCQQQSGAFFGTQLAFDGILVLVGCVLAYKTRDLDPKFGEAKQLGFSMYNVAFTGIVLVCIFQLVDLDQISQIVLQAVGVLWGSFFCSFAFVLPRLLEIAKQKNKRIVKQLSNKTWKDTGSGNQILVSTHLDSTNHDESQRPSSGLLGLEMNPGNNDYSSNLSFTGKTNTETEIIRSMRFIEFSDDSSRSSDVKSCQEANDELVAPETLNTCPQESYLSDDSSTDLNVVGSNVSCKQLKPEVPQSDLPAENVSNQCPSPNIVNDMLEYSSTKHMHSDQTKTQVCHIQECESQKSNTDTVSHVLDIILETVEASHSKRKYFMNDVAKPETYLANDFDVEK